MEFMPILVKGEKLAENITKASSGGAKDYPYIYEESRDRAIKDIEEINNEIENNRVFYLENEIILNVRMNEKFLAKSYAPSLFSKKESMEFVGARIYDRKIVKNKEIKSKLYFLKCSKDNLEWLINDLQNDNFNETEIKQLRSIEKIDLLKPEEKTLGFNEDEAIYEVEIVLHPIKEEFNNAFKKIESFLIGDNEIRKYKDGLTFILGKIKKDDLLQIAKFNFLRTVHPIREVNLPSLKEFNKNMGLPQIPLVTSSKSKLKIGVFDGGINQDNPYLKPYVNNYEMASLPADKKFLEHGTAVCGTVLYGEMNKYRNGELLNESKCTVENFRVLPEKNWYIIIDNIERIVNSRDDIDIYNVSIGPRGPILDDQIDRFTYSLDLLAMKNKVFCIAVGNDGNAVKPFNRIQSPSDSVNNIGVGAYSRYDNKVYRAGYSCIGSGREGGKIKPDLLAFGGDERNAFQVIDYDGMNRSMTAGTSFASPLVAKRLGELMTKSSQLNPLVSRTMLIHSARITLKNGEEEGFGIVSEDINDILNCSKNKITVLYEGFILPSRAIKLPIPLPDKKNAEGTINFSWTSCVLSSVSTKDSDLYTNACVEESFYPNSNIYNFTKKGVKKGIPINILENPEEVNKVEALGYKRSLNPMSDTAKRKSEIDRRLEYKWDTISKKSKGKMVENISEPFLIISALSRDDNDVQKIKFCVAVTIECKKYIGNMYEDILNKYEVLTPIEIEQEVESGIEEEVQHNI